MPPENIFFPSTTTFLLGMLTCMRLLSLVPDLCSRCSRGWGTSTAARLYPICQTYCHALIAFRAILCDMYIVLVDIAVIIHFQHIVHCTVQQLVRCHLAAVMKQQHSLGPAPLSFFKMAVICFYLFRDGTG